MVNNGHHKRKTFVLDTNVLIHNPESLFAFKDNRVVIPMKVMEELDKFKIFSDEKGLSARTVIRTLDKLRESGNLSKGVVLSNGGIIQIVVSYYTNDYLENENSNENYFDLIDTNVADNEIILTAYKLLRERKEKVIFVSKDLSSRIKANSMGLEIQDFEKQKVVFEELYTGYCDLVVKTDTINEFYTEKKLPRNSLNREDTEFFPNMYVMLIDEGNSSHTALGRYVKANDTIEKIQYTKSIWDIKPLNREQQFAFDALLNDNINLVTLIGQAGTGKTLVSLAAGLLKTIDEKIYSKLVVSRPVVPMGRDIGYLPGTKDEKLHFWMQPIFDNLRFIFNAHKKHKEGEHEDPDSPINYFKDKNQLELEALTYIRGRTLPHQFLIVDEAQNLTPHEVKTIISRAGEGTKVILTGDPYQIDNPYLDTNSNGLIYTIDRFKKQDIHAHITFTKSERSKLASLAAELL